MAPRNHRRAAACVLRCAAVMYSVFHCDATPAVGFKTSGGALITNHEDIRVSYAISGGCSIDHAFKAAASSSGVVDDAIVFGGIYQACVLSYAAYLGASSGPVSARLHTIFLNRSVVASSVVFDIALADSPLVSGASNTFKRESPYHSRHRRRVIIGVRLPVCCAVRLQCIPYLILTPRLQSGSRLRGRPSSQTTRTFEFPTPSPPEAAASIVLSRRQPLVWSMIPSFLWASTKPACCPSPPTSGQAQARCRQPAKMWHQFLGQSYPVVLH